METFELITKYAESKLDHYLAVRIGEYSINGNIIKIAYSSQYDWRDRNYDNFIEVELLDYITWVFNQK